MKNIKRIVLKYYKKYKEVINYLIFGVHTTVVNYIVYVLCAKLLNITITVSTGIAWVIAVLFAYITNKIYVFDSKTVKKKEITKELLSFFGFRALSGLLDVGIMWLSVDIMGFNDLIMKLVSNIIVVILNYFFSKMFIFKKNKK